VLVPHPPVFHPSGTDAVAPTVSTDPFVISSGPARAVGGDTNTTAPMHISGTTINIATHRQHRPDLMPVSSRPGRKEQTAAS
jgi:hypothetical protein